MIMVKDIYISLRDIKKMHFEGDGNECYMYITYRFDDTPIKLRVDDFGEYIELGNAICSEIRIMEA
ncbi:MAG: hypothetical protein IKL08_05955 [Clostridia bacterium]|nr:hypothetical protein [Clostridia bacterium]